MNKEPIGLYIFRYIINLVLLAFIMMLYWSYVLQEEDLKQIKLTLSELKNDIFSLHKDTNKIKEDVLQALLTEARGSQQNSDLNQRNFQGALEKKNKSVHSYMDDNYPNILKEDPFYTKTLPKMLGPNFQPKGIRRIATFGKPDNLHPFNNWGMVSAWVNQCNVSVATNLFGLYETYAPEMAIKMEERQNPHSKTPEFWIFLRNDVFWEPLSENLFSEKINLAPEFLRRHQVTAHDFKFYYDALMNPSVQEGQAVALRNFYEGIKEIEVIDDFTFVVRWKTYDFKRADGVVIPKIKYMAKLWSAALKPLASFVYKYFPDGKKIIEDDENPETYRTNSVWAQNFSQHWARNVIVSCGPWIFDGMTEREIRFKRNPHYFSPHAVLVEGMEVQFKDSPDAIWIDFQSGGLDSYGIQPNQLSDLENFFQSPGYAKQNKNKELSINRLDYLARIYQYVGWNQVKPFFKSKKVRQALTMAIDRKRIIKQNLNGMGVEITGTFFYHSPAYDSSIVPWPYDPRAAALLLQEEGWFDSDGDGIIDKMIDGKSVPFQFTLMYFVKNPITKTICESIATGLKEIGIDCRLNGVDLADLSAAFDDKSFDAVCLAWGLGTPPEDPKQLWSSSGAKEKGSSNMIGFSNAEVDLIIHQLEFESDAKRRIELYHSFNAILHEEAPYTFLYTPIVAYIYRNYLQNVFLPIDRQDLIPGADVVEPQESIFWLKKLYSDLNPK